MGWWWWWWGGGDSMARTAHRVTTQALSASTHHDHYRLANKYQGGQPGNKPAAKQNRVHTTLRMSLAYPRRRCCQWGLQNTSTRPVFKGCTTHLHPLSSRVAEHIYTPCLQGMQNTSTPPVFKGCRTHLHPLSSRVVEHIYTPADKAYCVCRDADHS